MARAMGLFQWLNVPQRGQQHQGGLGRAGSWAWQGMLCWEHHGPGAPGNLDEKDIGVTAGHEITQHGYTAASKVKRAFFIF